MKKIMHGLHNKSYSERKKHAVFLLMVCGNLSTAMIFSFLAEFLTAFIKNRC